MTKDEKKDADVTMAEGDKVTAPKDAKNAKDAKKEDENELVGCLHPSEEDLTLKEELEMLVERLKEKSNPSLYKPALEALRSLIRTSTSSMTSVPKPLKFLRPHYYELQTLFESWPLGENKSSLADIISVLAMSYDDGKRDSLKYRFLGASEPVGSWGHEYVRHLASELTLEYNARSENGGDAEAEAASAKLAIPQIPTADLIKLALEIVPFFLKHNAEADACDLLLELESLDKLSEYIDKDTYTRVCGYIFSMVPYVAPPDDISILKTVRTIYRKQEEWTQSILTSLRINDLDLVKDDYDSCTDSLTKKQLAFIAARQQVFFETDDEEITEILNNTKLSENFMALARDLNVVEAKTPEDIYKTHLENSRAGNSSSNVDSARQNLASTFVNAFVNIGFGSDKLMMNTEEGNSWIYKNKDTGMMSAAASLGSILLWDVEVGLTEIDKYLYSTDDNIKAGALLAIGLVSSGVRHESDPALGLLSEYISSTSSILRVAAIIGLGIAYAGSAREEVQELLLPLVSDTGLTMELSSLAALSLGLIYVGTSNGDIASTILQTLMERDDDALKSPYGRFMGVGLGLLFLGKQDASEATLETLKVIENPLAKLVAVIVDICSFVGTGNVLKIQSMLHLCNDHLDPAKGEDDSFQAFAVIGIALIAMGEDVGAEMAIRSFNHLMHYGEPVIRRAVPLALGVLCASNPLVNVLDILSKYSHDNDSDVALNAVFAMGLVGAGTNNARLAQMLRQLAVYYSKNPNVLFVVRIAQGLVHMGKGTVTLNPYHSNKTLLSPVAISGLLTVLTAFTDAKSFIVDKATAQYLLFFLIPATYPRFLMTLDENLKSIPVTVRVGQAVETVGQAGRPKTITGFQTHSTPVLLAYSERAELATEEYLAVGTTLEGFVILKKNPNWMEEDKKDAAK
ncbi:proteasome regulatory particle base subunit [Physocladia obscura]|uniref:26S proteasome regulatory subunit RPN1 n=1 Tax=Physocladia obscura TaxID=109957 RepID=A0AAD5XKR8_9FUNG|nr:proteasome regulatory particle base subunit [Physocladia obscura]